LSTTERNQIINNLAGNDEDPPVMRVRANRRRRYRFYDEEAESHDELINPREEEEYTDFRTYPLQIDWKDIENDESEAYEICDKYGLFGVSLFYRLTNNLKLKLKLENFVKEMIDSYIKHLDKGNIDNIKALENYINNLPKLEEIRVIIIKRLISHKELISIKIILDIYENFLKQYDYPLYDIYLNEFIPTALLFYSNLTEEDTKIIFDKIKNEKDVYELLKVRLKCIISKKKK